MALLFSLEIICTYSIAFDQRIAPNLVFHKSEETLHKIMQIINNEQKGAYLRFGDGEVNAAIGKDLILTTVSPELTWEIREAFKLNGPTILKSLPLHCREFGGFESGMFPGNHEWSYDGCLDLLSTVRPLWGAEITDVYSQVALHYLATYNQNSCINFLKFLRSKNCLFVGNENVPQHIRELLFGPESMFVQGPPYEAYSQIDRIEKECIEILNNSSGYKVVVVAIGCSGNILQKRLLEKADNIFIFNFGSLIDALCGWNTRAWISLSKFDAQQFLSFLSQETRILCTSALLAHDFEARKAEYMKSLSFLSARGYKPYVVEAIAQSGPTFLENYSDQVFYSRVNNHHLRNKGVNEARSMLAAFEHFGFKDNDMILKLTGRYSFNSDSFLKLIENNCDVDAFMKKDEHGQVFTGCFAMRCNYFKDMLRQIDLERMEYSLISLEREVANYIERNSHLNVMEVGTLGITARIDQNSFAELF